MVQNNIISQKGYWEQIKNRCSRRSPEHPVIKAFVDPKIYYIRKYVDISSNRHILDVGCGNGFFTYYLSKITNTIGLDYSRNMLLINPCETLVQGSALSLPFQNNTFDIVFCSNLLHHVETPEVVVGEMKRVSRKFIIISEPNRDNPFMALFSLLVPEERGALKFSLEYMQRLVEFCKLDIITSCSMGSVAPNKTPLSLLKWLMRIERKTILGFYNIVISSK